MTQSVDQSSITDVTSRRHKDPPGLWIAVVTSSVALHLLLFWLIRSNNMFSLWFPRRATEVIIPIEVIEISPTASQTKPPKPQLKAKTVSPPSANQKSSTVTARNENSSGINFAAIPKQRKRNTFVSKSNTQLVPKQSVPTPKPIFTPTPTSTQSQPIGEDLQTPSRRTPRQPIGEDSQTSSRRTPRQPIGEDSQTPSRRTPRQPIGEDSQTPSRRTPRQPIGEDSQTPQSRKTPQPATGAGIIAISRFLTPDELTPDEQRILIRDSLPKGLILPVHIGSNQKQIDSLSIKPNLDLPDKEFLTTLVIDKGGNLVQVVVEDPAIAPAQRGKYQQVANFIFQGDKFQPARSTNSTPVPELVNRFVRVKIQRR